MKMVISQPSADTALASTKESKTGTYNKRKVSDLRKGGQVLKGQERNQHSKEDRNTLLGISSKSDDFPQKKQKVVPSQHQCDLGGCRKVYKNENDL